MSGANTAISIKIRIRTSPASASRFWRKRNPISRMISLLSAFDAEVSIPNPRMDQGIQQVDQQIDHHERDRDKQDAALQQRVISVGDRRQDQLTHPGQGKDLLNQERK